MLNAQSKYTQGGYKKIEGWLGRIDSEMISSILDWQKRSGYVGGLAEIGLHHGKLFILLCLSMVGSEKAYGIDIFEDQALNLDGSGKGDEDECRKNLSAWMIRHDQYYLDKRSSLEVAPEEILERVGRVRFFSVDGGHSADVVINDLTLASHVLSDEGVIALDDFHRPEWPDVSLGLFRWFAMQRSTDLVPFAIGFNKLYLCRKGMASKYMAALSANSFLVNCLGKTYDFLGTTAVPIYQHYMLPEFGKVRRVREYVKLYHPTLFGNYHLIKGKLKHLRGHVFGGIR